MQLHSQAIPQSLNNPYYDAFTVAEMPEETVNMKIVVQTPARYIIDGLDIVAQDDDDDDDDAFTEPAHLQPGTTRTCLFCFIPTLSLACIFIFAMEMIAISKSDNNGFPAEMDQQEGATMTPTDYYQWIDANNKKKHMSQDKNSGNNDTSPTVKNHMWTWVGGALLASAILLLLLARGILMLQKKCSATSVSNQTKPSATATATAQVTISSKKKKKRPYHQTNNPILMGSLLMGMVGTWIIFMDQVALAYGKPVGGHPITDNSISCLMKDSAEVEYLTSCEVVSTLSSQACPILKAACQDHICQHLVPNSTDITQPPKLDNQCYYPNPAEPPCMQSTVKCSDMYALPTNWNVKIILCIIISSIVLIFFGMTGLLYHMAHLHLTMQQSLWAEGVASKHYMTEADGHPKPTWRKLMKDTYCFWSTTLYQPPCICMQCFAEPSPAFADDNDDIPEEDRHRLAQDDLPADSPVIHNHAASLSDTSNTTSSSSAVLTEQAANEGGACANVGRVHPTRRRPAMAEGHQQQASFVAQQWKSDQHLEDGRPTLKNSNFFFSVDLLSSDEEAHTGGAQQPVHTNNNITTTPKNVVFCDKKDVADEFPLPSTQYKYF